MIWYLSSENWLKSYFYTPFIVLFDRSGCILVSWSNLLHVVSYLYLAWQSLSVVEALWLREGAVEFVRAVLSLRKVVLEEANLSVIGVWSLVWGDDSAVATLQSVNKEAFSDWLELKVCLEEVVGSDTLVRVIVLVEGGGGVLEDNNLSYSCEAVLELFPVELLGLDLRQISSLLW